MKSASAYIAVCLCMCLFMGCNTSSSEEKVSSTGHEVIKAGNMNRIAGIQWTLQKMTVDGQDYPLEGEKPFIKIESDGKVSGFASVNRYFGSVQVNEEGDLKWSPFGSTRMAGSEKMMKQEDLYLKAIPMTEQMSIEGIHLYLSSKSQQTELVFFVPVE